MLANTLNLSSIRWKILFGNGILITILVAAMLYTVTLLSKNISLSERQSVLTSELSEIQEVQGLLSQVRQNHVEFLLLFQNKSKQLRDDAFTQLVQTLEGSNIGDPSLFVANIQKIDEKIELSTLAFINNDRITAAFQLNEFVEQSIALEQKFQGLINDSRNRINESANTIGSTSTTLSFVSYLLLAVTLILGTTISIILANIISKNIIKVKDTVESIERNGDLTQRISVKTNDEVGQLANSINNLVDSVGNIVKEVSTHSENLAAASEKLEATANDTNAAMEKEFDEIKHIVKAIDSMSESMAEVTHKVQSTTEAAKTGHKESQNGIQIVSDASQACNQLATEVTQSSDEITKLEQESQNIGRVLDVIISIAEQTNLLALNAAIEAARAGEQGRGFAVVADEVRSLAQKTQESTAEIQNLMETLQSGTGTASQSMNQSLTQVNDTVAKAEQASASFTTIVDSISNVMDMSEQIASSAQEQTSINDEINTNIQNIRKIAEQAVQASETTHHASSEMKELGTQLKVLVQQFKVA